MKHIIVCGHYGCGGVAAAIDNPKLGLINNWLLHIRDLYIKNREWMGTLTSQQKVDKLCEINVIEQVYNLANSTIIQSAWEQGQEVTIHGVIYSLCNGKLNDLNMTCNSFESLEEEYHQALTRIRSSSARVTDYRDNNSSCQCSHDE